MIAAIKPLKERDFRFTYLILFAETDRILAARTSVEVAVCLFRHQIFRYAVKAELN